MGWGFDAGMFDVEVEEEVDEEGDPGIPTEETVEVGEDAV